MQIHARASARAYYDVSPSAKHSTGDIWRDLPSHSLLKVPICAGLVITPSCDLANDKVETITYLPILPVGYYFTCPAFFPEIRIALAGALKLLGMEGIEELLPKGRLPQVSIIDRIAAFVEAERVKLADKAENPAAQALNRCTSCISHLRKMLDANAISASPSELESIFPAKDWQRIREGIVRNSYRADVHFLPADREDAKWSAIPEHSVILFRYPFTVSLEILNHAATTAPQNWFEEIQDLSKSSPAALPFVNGWPCKTLTLNKDFLSDVLTRFVALYLRIGSPDFEEQTVTDFAGQIAGK